MYFLCTSPCSLKMGGFMPKHVAVIICLTTKPYVLWLFTSNFAHKTQRYEPHRPFHMSFFYLGFILVAGRDRLCEMRALPCSRSRAFRFSA
jgi:heme O synthase-like polyprenyltransferase